MGIICVLAGLLFAVTATTARGTDLRPGESGDPADLIRNEQQRIAKANSRVAALQAEVSARAAEVEAAQPGGSDPADKARAEALARVTGLAGVRGPSLTVVLDDAPQKAQADVSNDELVVHQQDVQGVVNALWAGGAEAMQLMDQRVISTSAVRCVGSTLLLQGRIYPPPYKITAIGPVEAMAAALNESPTVEIYRQYVDLVGLGYDVSRGSSTLPAYEGPLGISLAKVPTSSPTPTPTPTRRRSGTATPAVAGRDD